MDNWTTADVLAWVERSFTGSLQERLKEGLAARGATGSSLRGLDDEDLRMMGVGLSSFRKRVLAKVKAVVPGSLVCSNTILPGPSEVPPATPPRPKAFASPGEIGKRMSPGVARGSDRWQFAQQSEPRKMPDCKYGRDCRRRDCPFSHALRTTADVEIQDKICRDGDHCARSNCWFKHPSGLERRGLCIEARAKVTSRNRLPGPEREVAARFRRPGKTQLNHESRSVGTMNRQVNPDRKIRWIVEPEMLQTAGAILRGSRDPASWTPGGAQGEAFGWIKHADFTRALAETYPHLSELPMVGAFLACKYPFVEMETQRVECHDVPFLRLVSGEALDEAIATSQKRQEALKNEPLSATKHNRQVFQMLKSWFDQRPVTEQVIRGEIHSGQERDLQYRFAEGCEAAGALLFMPRGAAANIVREYGEELSRQHKTSAAQLLAIPVRALTCCAECVSECEVGVDVALCGSRVDNTCAGHCPLRKACKAGVLPSVWAAGKTNEPIATVRPYLLRRVLERYPTVADASVYLPEDYVALCQVQIPNPREFRARGTLTPSAYCHIDVGITAFGKVHSQDREKLDGTSPGLFAALRRLTEQVHVTTSEGLLTAERQREIREVMGLKGFPYKARFYGDGVHEHYFIVLPRETTVEHRKDQEMVIRRGGGRTKTRRVTTHHINGDGCGLW